ncbi:tRNA (guanine(9)-N(1))-methyltransferase [Haplosporangium sp. Z 11]|nr:tRNA (guanine(9)-N(1))-methyltransferase [Haplosporangium sp. Z 11]
MSEPMESNAQEGRIAGAAAENTTGSIITGNSVANVEAATVEAKDQQTSSDSSKPQNNPFWKPRPPPMIGPDGQPLSRNATKKLLKQQQFLERRPQMRAQEKLKRKQKEKDRREAIESGLIAPPPKRQKLDQTHSGITIGIDMSFDDLMLEKEVKSMVDQIKRCYSHNRTCDKIVHLALTSFTGKSKDEFSKRANGYELWRNFSIHEKSLEEVWPSEEIPGKDRMEELKKLQVIASAKSEAIKAKALAAMATSSSETTSSSATTETTESSVVDASSGSTTTSTEQTLSEQDMKALEQERLEKEEKLAIVPAVKKVVYLSADSPNTISQLDPGTCYILGGIVDKNRFPRLCQNKAEKLGLETAQLPIGDYIQMSSRRILTVNQVFEILMQFIECNDWKEAFLKVIPQRKLEEKQRVRRSTEAWRGQDRKAGQTTATSEATSSVASSVADDESEDDEGEGEEDRETTDAMNKAG